MTRGKIILLVLALICLAFLLSGLRSGDLQTMFERMSLGFAAIGLLTSAASYLLKAIRYQIFIGSTQGFRRMFGVTIAHQIVSQIFPMRLGDVSYIVLLQRAKLATVGHGLTSLLLCRFADMVILWVMFIATLPLLSNHYPALFWSGMALGVLLLAGLVFLAALLARGRIMAEGTRQFLERTGLLRWAWSARLWEQIEGGIGPLRTIRSPRNLFLFLLFSAAIWTASVYCNYCIWRGVGIALSLPQIVFLTALSYLFTLLPIFLFAGVGTGDLIHAGILMMFGISKPESALVSLANRVLVTAYLFILSALAFAVMRKEWPLLTRPKEPETHD